jgi:hypothetical protein
MLFFTWDVTCAYPNLFLVLASTNPSVGIRIGCIKEQIRKFWGEYWSKDFIIVRILHAAFFNIFYCVINVDKSYFL